MPYPPPFMRALYGPLAPALHGALGPWDEIIFGAGFVISIIIFIALALSDRKRDRRQDGAGKDADGDDP